MSRCIGITTNINAHLPVGWMQFVIGQFVTLMNPKNARQKVAFSKVNGGRGVEKFHGTTIVDFWFKIDVATTHMPKNPLKVPHEVDEHTRVGDVVGTCTLWNWKFVKIASWQTF